MFVQLAFISIIILSRYRSFKEMIKGIPKVLSLCALCFTIISVLIVYNQENLLYRGSFATVASDENPEGYQNPEERGLEYEDIKFEGHDGTKLHSWLIFGPNSNKSRSYPTIMLKTRHYPENGNGNQI
ncbi:COBW domain-containing protein 1, variant 2 [Bonamia ostreae]|uniref:COBW domain-containing protein 1, variant 2 n=1 Tax=Bonamia ostreae TaxID=126728 RepID=A0ABV2AUZ5_9EUKA